MGAVGNEGLYAFVVDGMSSSKLKIAHSFRLFFSFSIFQDLSHSSLPLLGSISYPVDELDDIRGCGKIILDTFVLYPSPPMHCFFFTLNTRQRARSTRTINVVARRSLFVVRRSFRLSFSSSHYPPAPLPMFPPYIYSSGPSGSIPRLRHLVLRDMPPSIRMTDAAVIAFLSPIPLFSVERYRIFTPYQT